MAFLNQISLKNLSPANFAFVMSSGVVSMIFHRTDWIYFSWIFLIIGSIGYAALISLFIVRLFVLKMKALQDFKDIQKMFKYLTFSSGSSALAVSYCLSGYNQVGLILGLVGVISTIVLTYILCCTLFFHNQVPIQIISPFWLLLAIACNYSGIVITTLWKNEMLTNNICLLFSFCFSAFGVSIYLIFMTLNIFRMIFYSFNGVDMDPCYWTCMGAAAIAVVDGNLLILIPNPPQFLHEITPFIEGMLVFLWGWATAWIPILCFMELWKIAHFKIPFHYQPSSWAIVFPMGMYTTAIDLLNRSVLLDILQGMIPVSLWITFFLWCLVAYMSKLNPFSNSIYID